MGRVLFLWTKSVLDRRSGAAASMKATLEALAEAGFECHAITMTVFDGDEAFPLERLIAPDHLVAENRGRFLQAEHRGVGHWLFYTCSTVARNVEREELRAFVHGAGRLLAHVNPDIVVTTGSSEPAQYLHRMAARHDAKTVFYLANATFDDPRLFAGFDRIWCPSRTLADHCARTLGLPTGVLRNVLSEHSFAQPDARRPGNGEDGHRRYVTFVNPSPEKGATLFFRLADLARRERPELRFLAVEGRVARRQWRRCGIDPDAYANVLWVSNRRDMRPVYRRTRVLLCPSYCFEAAGRVVAEAQLSGIPVLAANRGGLPEQLNGGGFVLDPPRRCVDEYLYMPTDE